MTRRSPKVRVVASGGGSLGAIRRCAIARFTGRLRFCRYSTSPNPGIAHCADFQVSLVGLTPISA